MPKKNKPKTQEQIEEEKAAKEARKAELENESKADKFKRLVEARMKKTFKALKTIMNLSSPAYESTPDQQEKIINALKLKVQDIENSFKAQEKITEEFKL